VVEYWDCTYLGIQMVDLQETHGRVPDKLVNWTNPPKLGDLKQDLLDAKPHHDTHCAEVKAWLDNLNIEGEAKLKAKTDGSSIVPKLIRKQAEWRYPALSDPFLSTEDLFNVKPISWEDTKAAQQNTLLLNNQFNTKIDKQTFIDEFVRTVVDEGTAVLQTSWVFEEEDYEAVTADVTYVVDPSVAPLHEQLEQMKEADPSQYYSQVPEELRTAHAMTMEQGQSIKPVITGHSKKKLKRTVKNHPMVEVCHYKNVVIDPSCQGDIRKARFVIKSFETSKSELSKDARYKNLDFISLESSSPLNNPDHSSSAGNFNFKDDPRKLFVVHEYWGYWDIHGKGITTPVVLAWVGNTYIRMEENPFPDKELPFISVPYLPRRKNIYGEPDGALLEENQKIIGAVTRGMIDIMGKSANGQTGIRKDMLDTTNRRKFDKGMDYEFNANVDPRQGIHMHTYPEIPQSAQFMLQLQQFEAESLTGVKAFNQGIGSQSLGDVAAGIRGALDAASKRELSILRRLSAAIISVARKFIAMNSIFLNEEEVVRVTNEKFVLVRRDDLSGSFDLALSISTAEEDNNKAQELAFMLQTMGNNMDPGMSRMILADIARLRKMPELAKKIETYQPQPDPLMQQKQQLEIQLLQAQLENELAHAMERKAGAQLDLAKSGTESVKAGHIKADTDKKNLDFVEQESGVTQERQMQLHGEQARSQAQLKLLEFDLSREKNHTDLLKTYIQTRARNNQR
jgi:hypothetical protein